MSLFPVGSSALDQGASTGPRTSPPADPEAFAASLRSASGGDSTAAGADAVGPSQTSAPSGSTPTMEPTASIVHRPESAAAPATGAGLAAVPDPEIAPVGNATASTQGPAIPGPASTDPTILAAAIATPAPSPESPTTDAVAPPAASAGAPRAGATGAPAGSVATGAQVAAVAGDAASGASVTPPAAVSAETAGSPGPTAATEASPVAGDPPPLRRTPRHAGESEATPAPVSAAVASLVPAPASADSPVDGTSNDTAVVSTAAVGTAAVGATAVGATALAAVAGTPTRQSAVTFAADSSDGSRSTVAVPSTAAAGRPVEPLTTESASPPVAASAAIGNDQRPAARASDAASTPFAAAGLGQAAVTQTGAGQPVRADAAAAPQTAQPLNQQLAPAVLNLRSAGVGTHVLTVTVSPESVGPVTVRAHISGDGVRVELSAPTDQGRDALLSMLPDLKRDLSQGGMNSALSVASPGSDAATAGGQSQFGSSGGAFARDDRPNYSRTAASPGLPATSARPASARATTALDVLA